MTSRNDADPTAPNFKEAFAQLAETVRELVGSQAQAQLMRLFADSDVNIGQSRYQPSEELIVREIVDKSHRIPANSKGAGFTVSETESLESDAITPPVLCPSTPAWTRAVATGGAADPHSRSLLSGSI